MLPQVLHCRQCAAPLHPSRFARWADCTFCGTRNFLAEDVVFAARFREAFAAWNDPAHHGFTNHVSLGTRHWALVRRLGHGDTAEVHLARRARNLGGRVVLKVLRPGADPARFDNGWHTLTALQQSTAPGASHFGRLLPQPLHRGALTGLGADAPPAQVLSWLDGFEHDFAGVRTHLPGGVPPRSAIWMWRRVLELLTFVHAAGFAHGAVTPEHLLVQTGEHGVRLVGFGQARPSGEEGTSDDVRQSAQALAAVLGDAVPEPLAELVAEVSHSPRVPTAWDLRERLGALAQKLFGPPAFCPLPLPPL